MKFFSFEYFAKFVGKHLFRCFFEHFLEQFFHKTLLDRCFHNRFDQKSGMKVNTHEPKVNSLRKVKKGTVK